MIFRGRVFQRDSKASARVLGESMLLHVQKPATPLRLEGKERALPEKGR